MSRASEYAANASRILQAKGDAIAQGHLTRGNIIGNTIATLGQVIPQQVQEVMKRNAEKRKTEQIHGILGKYPNDLGAAANEIMAIDRDIGMKLLDQNMQAKKFAMETSKFDDEMKQRKRSMLLKPFLTARNADEWDQARLNAKVAGAEAEIPYVQMEWSPDIRQRILLEQMSPKDQYEQEYPTPEKQGGSWIETSVDGQAGRVYSPNVPGSFVPAPPPSVKAAADATLGSFEDYVVRYARDVAKKPVESLTAADIQNARKLYQQADDRPRAGAAGTGGGTSRLPASYQAALSRATINLPAVRRGNLETAARLAFEQGGEAALADVVRQAAVDTEPVDIRNQVMGRMATLASINDTEAILKEMKQKGVPTNILVGTAEDVARKLGTSTNPEYVALANRLMGTLINYRRAATGVQFSQTESADYQRMFPNYRNTLPVNLALLSGLRREMATYDKTYWTHKLGAEGAQLVGVIPKDDGGGGGGGGGGGRGAAPPLTRPSSGNPYGGGTRAR